MIRLYIYAGIAAAILAAGFYVHHLRVSNTALTAELSTAKASLLAQAENLRKANESDQRQQARADALEADKREHPLPAVRMCRSPKLPTTGATTQPNEAAQADNAGADAGDSGAGIDIGPGLDNFATDAEMNLVQCQELQRWVRER